jgi:hypothetical protein
MINLGDFFKAIHSAVSAASSELIRENLLLTQDYFESDDPTEVGGVPTGKLKAKTVTLQYPAYSENGEVVMKDVHVPLIALIPITMPEISEVKFRTNLELFIENDNLQVNFSPKKLPSGSGAGWGVDEKSETNGGMLEITIIPNKGTDGLNYIIDGYEKVLRGQIPH